MEKPTRVVGQKRWVEVLRGENGRSMGWVEVFCQSDLFGRGIVDTLDRALRGY